MKIIIIGASGFLGKRLFNYFKKKCDVIGTYSKNNEKGMVNLDATNYQKVLNFITHHKPDIVIDTVALTSSVLCEKNPDLCYKLNYQTAKNIVGACREINAKMIFLSSSYLFNGEKGYYSEEDITNGNTQYGKTKIKAEKAVSALKDYLILRVDMLYGIEKGKVKFGARTFDRVIEIGYPNQIRTPVFIDDIPKIINKLIFDKKKGIFHIAGPDKIKTIDFMEKLAEIENSSGKIKIVSSEGWVVKSPLNSSLNISKLRNEGIDTTTFKEALMLIKETKKSQTLPSL